MTTVQVPTSELVGDALDYAVAIAIKLPKQPDISRDCITPFIDSDTRHLTQPNIEPFKPSTKWAHGGPLIQKYALTFAKFGSLYQCVKKWFCGEPVQLYPAGDTHLIAAMRAIVGAELGEIVEIPEELVK